MSARKFLGVAVLCAAAMSFATASYAQDQVKIRFILNWKYQGPQAWFFLAQDKGYFKAEGLDVHHLRPVHRSPGVSRSVF